MTLKWTKYLFSLLAKWTLSYWKETSQCWWSVLWENGHPTSAYLPSLTSLQRVWCLTGSEEQEAVQRWPKSLGRSNLGLTWLDLRTSECILNVISLEGYWEVQVETGVLQGLVVAGQTMGCLTDPSPGPGWCFYYQFMSCILWCVCRWRLAPSEVGGELSTLHPEVGSQTQWMSWWWIDLVTVCEVFPYLGLTG